MDNLVQNMTIGRQLEETAKRFPMHSACTDSYQRYTYAGLNRRTDRIACGLLKMGIRKGTHVGLLTNDNTKTLSLYYALWKIGAVVIPLCTSLRRVELEYCLVTADVEWLLIDAGYKNVDYESMCSRLEVDVRIISVANERCIEKIIACGKGYPKVKLENIKGNVFPEDVDTILFTSGTTGVIKPVETTHFSRVNSMILQASTLQVNENDRYCSALPMYHCFSLTATVLAAAAVGACVCFPKDRHTYTILSLVEKDRCTVLTAVPALFDALMRRQKSSNYNVSSLQKGLIGGSAYPESFYRNLCDTFGFKILPSLGQTEATAGITVAGSDDSIELLSRSIGKAFPHLEVCVKNPRKGNVLPYLETGELCVRGYCVMKGYYHDQAATNRVIDKDGWLHTGDLVYQDQEGNLFYRGRIKDIIIRGGENISPAELESVLMGDHRIREARVIGVPDSHYYEEICACIVKKADLSEEDVKAYLRGKVAPFKLPKYVLFFSEFPKTSLNKIQTEELRRIARNRLGLQELS